MGIIKWVTARVETATHYGETTVPVITHIEYLYGKYPPIMLLGKCVGPRVRVRMLAVKCD